jgi:hypothetical protein
MSESYRHKPQHDQIKYLSKASGPTPSLQGMRSTRHGPVPAPAPSNCMMIDPFNMANPRNIVILLGIILLLLMLLFLGMRNVQNNSASKLDTLMTQLKQLSQHQQLLFKAQQNQLEMSQTNSMRADDLRQGLSQDFRQLLSTIVTVPHQITQHATPASGPDDVPCENDDGTGSCSQFARRSSQQPQGQSQGQAQAQAQTQANPVAGASLPRLLPALGSQSVGRPRSFT